MGAASVTKGRVNICQLVFFFFSHLFIYLCLPLSLEASLCSAFWTQARLNEHSYLLAPAASGLPMGPRGLHFRFNHVPGHPRLPLARGPLAHLQVRPLPPQLCVWGPLGSGFRAAKRSSWEGPGALGRIHLVVMGKEGTHIFKINISAGQKFTQFCQSGLDVGSIR